MSVHPSGSLAHNEIPSRNTFSVVGWLADRKVATKVLLCAAVGVIAALVVGLVSMTQTQSLGSRVTKVDSNGLVPVSKLSDLREAVLVTRNDATAAALYNDARCRSSCCPRRRPRTGPASPRFATRW